MLLEPSPVRLAVLDSTGTKTKILYLPIPSDGGLEIDWEPKEKTWDVEDGELTRKRGYLPVLTCKWTYYDERPGRYAIGLNDGQRPTLENLLWLLSQPSGTLRVSPGLHAGGFTVDRCLVKPIAKRGLIYQGVQVVFRARKLRPVRDIEVF